MIAILLFISSPKGRSLFDYDDFPSLVLEDRTSTCKILLKEKVCGISTKFGG